jgi:hypothetical protein
MRGQICTELQIGCVIVMQITGWFYIATLCLKYIGYIKTITMGESGVADAIGAPA